MIASPTERWGAWLAAARTDENMLMHNIVRDVVLQDLKKEGFAVPAQRALNRGLDNWLGGPADKIGEQKGGGLLLIRPCLEPVMVAGAGVPGSLLQRHCP